MLIRRDGTGTTWPRAIVWWTFMVLLGLLPLVGLIVLLIGREWGRAIVQAIVAAALLLMVRNEIPHWREMIPPRHDPPTSS